MRRGDPQPHIARHRHRQLAMNYPPPGALRGRQADFNTRHQRGPRCLVCSGTLQTTRQLLQRDHNTRVPASQLNAAPEACTSNHTADHHSARACAPRSCTITLSAGLTLGAATNMEGPRNVHPVQLCNPSRHLTNTRPGAGWQHCTWQAVPQLHHCSSVKRPPHFQRGNSITQHRRRSLHRPDARPPQPEERRQDHRRHRQRLGPVGAGHRCRRRGGAAGPGGAVELGHVGGVGLRARASLHQRRVQMARL